jgi:pantoate--beta-alanine ligase
VLTHPICSSLDVHPSLAELRARSIWLKREAEVTENRLNKVRTVAELRHVTAGWRKENLTVALVPTMGALHVGHLALVKRATEIADRTLVSIFVNPSQFAPNEDLSHYPRDETGDFAKLTEAGCDLAWVPAPLEIYPAGFATRIMPAGTAFGLESSARPHFFGAVATVCCKLFAAATPDFAVFGEKDYQQLCVIQQMVRDLNLALEIVAVPTVREADGLAFSSRNAYLLPKERAIAPVLHRVICEVAVRAKRAVAEHDGDANRRKTPRPSPLLPEPGRSRDRPQLSELDTICEEAVQELERAGFTKVDYVAVREAGTLEIVRTPTARPLRVLAAASLGETRLIDNVPANQ